MDDELTWIVRYLLIRRLVDAAGLARAVEAQAEKPSTLGRALARLGLADESVVAVETACALHLALLDVTDSEPPPVDAKAAALLPAEFCQKRGVAPLALEGNVLRIAVDRPDGRSGAAGRQVPDRKETPPSSSTHTGLDELFGRSTRRKSVRSPTTC